jgi:hypothetical protein
MAIKKLLALASIRNPKLFRSGLRPTDLQQRGIRASEEEGIS